MLSDSDEDTPRRPSRELWQTIEGRIFLSGLVLALLFAGWLMLNFLLGHEQAHIFMAMTTTNIIFGRAAGMSLGYSVGLGHDSVIPINMVTESILVLLFYPLFVFSWNQLVEVRGLKGTMFRLRTAGHRHEDKIRKFGVPGLFLFVWFPFWMTGPVVGAVIGFLIDLKPAQTLTVVLSGTFLAMCVWAVLLHELHDAVAVFSPYGPMVLVLIIVLLAMAGHLLQKRNHRKTKSSEESD